MTYSRFAENQPVHGMYDERIDWMSEAPRGFVSAQSLTLIHSAKGEGKGSGLVYSSAQSTRLNRPG